MLDKFDTDKFASHTKQIIVKGCQESIIARDTCPEFIQINQKPEADRATIQVVLDTIKHNAEQRYVCPLLPNGASDLNNIYSIGLEYPAFSDWQNPTSGLHNFLVPSKTGSSITQIQYTERLLLNMLLAFPAGSLTFTFVDLGMQGIMFPFSEGLDQTLYRSVMDQRTLSETIDRLQAHMSSTLPQYTNIEKYNAEHKTIEFPYEIVVLVDYPNKISQTDIERMTALFENGHKAGIYFVILHNDEYVWDDKKPNLLKIKNYSVVKDLTPADPVRSKALTHTPFASMSTWRKATFAYINNAYKIEKNKKPTLTIPTFSPDYYENTDVELTVPIGRTKDLSVDFRLDCVDHIHTFIIGQSGSGKSVLLHNMVTGLIQKYAPEDLQLYMLDFKLGGVEFNRYRNLNHVKALLVDNNDDNITLEILRDVMEQMTLRGRKLRDAGVSDIRAYNKQNPKHHMPQVVFVVDECHELFKVGENGRHQLQNEILRVVTKISKEGRSQGVHLLMATQTLAGTDIPQSILNNVTDHYLLKCSAMDSDRLVERSSRFTYNQSVGQVYYHHTGEEYQFRSFFVPNDELTQMVDKAAEKASSHRNNGKFYFSGSQVFSINRKSLDVCSKDRNVCAIPGSSIDLKQQPIAISLEADYCENIMIFGIDEKEQVSRTSMALLASLIMDSRSKKLNHRFYIIDCLGKELLPQCNALIDSLENAGLCQVARTREEKGNILLKLANATESATSDPSVLVILGQHRFKELRRNARIPVSQSTEMPVVESFKNEIEPSSDIDDIMAQFGGIGFDSVSVSSSPQEGMTYKEALNKILDDGPEKSIHTILQIDKPEHFLFQESVYSNMLYSKFGHFIMLHSDENATTRMNIRNDIHLEDLSSDNERLRAYYYSYMDDTYKLFSPYTIPEIDIIKQ